MLVDAVTWGVGLVVKVPANDEEINMEGQAIENNDNTAADRNGM